MFPFTYPSLKKKKKHNEDVLQDNCRELGKEGPIFVPDIIVLGQLPVNETEYPMHTPVSSL